MFSVGVAAYLSSVLCRFARKRHRKPSFLFAPLSIAGTGMLTVLCVYQEELLHPSRWDNSKAPMEVLFLILFAISCALAVIPALPVVAFYRMRNGDKAHPANH